MDGQRKLTYYIAYLTDATLFAYGDYYEFFRTYDEEKGQWEISRIPFSMMLHDFQCRVISEEQAKKLTGNNLPVDDYKKYCDLLSGSN